MRKILFYMFSFSGGGAERTVVNIINNLNRSKYKPVLVIGTNKDAPYLDDISKDVKIVNLNVSKLRYSLLPLCKCIQKEKPDVLFSTVNPNNILLSIAKLFSFRKNKLIVREANNRTQSGKVNIINKILTFLTYNFIADKIIALSSGVKDDLITNFNIKSKKIEVIHNPVEVDYIKKVSHDPIKDFDFNEKYKRIVAVGRLVEQKDYPTLLKAFKMISEKNIQLIILGKGSLEQSLKEMCKRLGIENKVFFLGFKKNPYKYMRRSDVFVLSSKWEGFGHVIVEAMASGIPVISTDCKSGPAEIIKENKYGVLVPTENPNLLAENIKEILSNDQLKKSYSQLGEIRADSFNSTNIIKQYEGVFDIN
jgi:glycosyltransferase involved in cell wall biosynthesis